MRIALVTREYPPETAWGGIGAFYASFAKSLTEAGHQVEVFSQALESESIGLDGSIRVTRVMGRQGAFGRPTPGAQSGDQDLGLFALGLARALHAAVARRHAEAPFDVIEGHEHLGVTALIHDDASIQALKVVRYHGAYHSLVTRGFVDWPASRLVEALERASITKADLRISVSSGVDAAVVEDFGVPPAEVVIPNFVKAQNWTGSWSDKDKQVLFVGRLVLNLKRPDLAVEAFCRFATDRPDWTLLLVGLDQSYDKISSVWNHIESSIPAALKGRIRHLGPQTPAEVYSLMGRSRALVMPSEFESFGMVAVEAMLHGCLPLVASGTGAADVVPDAKLVCRRGSAESFAQGLEALLGDERLSGAEALSTRIVGHARETFAEVRLRDDSIATFEQARTPRRRAAPAPASEVDAGPLVSIVVPNFNGDRFLDETLRSISGQDYSNLEVILVDGGSTDDSLQIARRYPSVRIIRQPDTGQAHAINRGLMQARGNILAYLNADDLYRPNAISAVVEHFRRRPETMLLCGSCDNIDAEGHTVGSPIQPAFSGQQGVIRYWGWGRWHAIPQPASFWRRELMEQVGLFDTRLHFAFDLDYWVRATGRYPMVAVPETLAAFRLADGSKTVSQTDKMYAEEYQVFRRYWRLLPWPARLAASTQAAAHYSGKLLGLGEHLWLGEGRRRAGAALALQSVKVFPPRALDLRVWLLAWHGAVRAVGLGALADRLHRSILWRWPRPSQRRRA